MDGAGTERVVVVGAGMGGLAAALLLAHAGREVVVCEAQPQPGGKARQVAAGGRPVDSGPTVCTMPWVFEQLFAAVGEDFAARLAPEPCGVLARHAWTDGGRLDLFADPARSEAAVAEFAGPEEAARFAAFRARAGRIYRALAPTFIEAQKPTPLAAARAIGPDVGLLRDLGFGASMWAALGREFRDPRLRQLFGRYATYVGGSPWASPALLMLIWHVEERGVLRLPGGMHGLARCLAGLAAARGAALRFGAPVARILTGGSRVRGVRLADGEEIASRAVVFNGDAAALGAGLMGPGAQGAAAPVRPGQRALSALTLTALADPGDWPLAHHTVFFSDDYRAEFDDILRRRRLPRQPTTYLCAADRGGGDGAAPGSPERLFAIINAPACGDTHPFSPEEIETCQENALSLLARCGLRLRLMPGTVTATGPAEFARLFPGSGGALYGRTPHGLMAGFRRPGARSRLPGLYLAGGTVHPGAGVPMAVLSGRRAAEALLADLASTCRFRPAAMPGGTSTASATTAPAP